jgi:hypothetical protein
MRSFEDLVPHDELPRELIYTGQTCAHGGPQPCGAPADISIWIDYGVHRHRWTETTTLCSDHFISVKLPSHGRALPIIECATTLLYEKEGTERPLGTGGGD